MTSFESAWKSTVHKDDDWPTDSEDIGCSSGNIPPLVLYRDGHIRIPCEYPSRPAPVTAELVPSLLYEEDLQKRHFQDTFLGRIKYLHLLSDIEEDIKQNPVIATVEVRDDDEDVRAIVRTKKGDERMMFPSGSSTTHAKHLAALMGLESKKAIAVVRDCEVFDKELVRYEVQTIRPLYKWGVLYTLEGQSEDEWYSNRTGSPEFDEFLALLGERVTLNGFAKYRGGLDVKNDTTGTESVYTAFQGNEIMFHVSTLLKFTEDDPQQVERKRHLGNDLIMIIFRDSDSPESFDPLMIHSQFNHVFIVVMPELISGQRFYRVAVTVKDGVPAILPALPRPSLFAAGESFRLWLLTFSLNAERAAFYAPSFIMKVRTTRKTQLEQIISDLDPKLKERKGGTLVGGGAVSAFKAMGAAAPRNVRKGGSVIRQSGAVSKEKAGQPRDPSSLVIGTPSNFQHVATGEKSLLAAKKEGSTHKIDSSLIPQSDRPRLISPGTGEAPAVLVSSPPPATASSASLSPSLSPGNSVSPPPANSGMSNSSGGHASRRVVHRKPPPAPPNAALPPVPGKAQSSSALPSTNSPPFNPNPNPSNASTSPSASLSPSYSVPNMGTNSNATMSPRGVSFVSSPSPRGHKGQLVELLEDTDDFAKEKDKEELEEIDKAGRVVKALLSEPDGFDTCFSSLASINELLGIDVPSVDAIMSSGSSSGGGGNSMSPRSIAPPQLTSSVSMPVMQSHDEADGNSEFSSGSNPGSRRVVQRRAVQKADKPLPTLPQRPH